MNADDTLVADGDFTEVSGYYAMQKLLAARPDAVFCASDVMAIGAMRAARESGLRIPQDVAFVSFDDLPLATIPEPKLTTIRQPIYRFGFKAVEILVDLIEHGNLPHHHVIMDTELVVRESCGARQKVVVANEVEVSGVIEPSEPRL
jgi:DNA-binding LacI/PurR family transcriptional regulator